MHAEIGAQSSAAPGEGFWDLEEALPPLRTRVLRAAAVAGAWGVSALPLVLGVQQCTVATLLHRPCPGCGMTRAIRLLAHGQVGASLAMHPLAGPVLAAGLFFMASTVWATLVLGSPVRVHRSRVGSAAIKFGIVVYAATFVLWTLRWFGWFGGPVPVY